MSDIDTRLVATEVKLNVATLNQAVNALQIEVSTLHATTDQFLVDTDNGLLPDPLVVQSALAGYDAINVVVSKPANSLSDSLAVIRAAE